MVDPIYREAVRPRNHDRKPYLAADRQRRRAHEPGSGQHPDLVDHPLVSPHDQLRLVAAVEAEHRIALGDLVACIPDHPAPTSAVLALVDAGLLAIDMDAPFDAAVQLWRSGPPPFWPSCWRTGDSASSTPR